MRKQAIFVLTIAGLLCTACAEKASKEQMAQADRLIEKSQKERDYNRLISLADSFENEGSLSHAKADYWRGYASDRMKKMRMAEFYWKTSLETASMSEDEADLETYAMSASRLTNLLSVRGDYEGALKAAVPVAERLEALKCDSTADYINLLIYIGCCQAGLGQAGSAAIDGFERAYKKHLDNIEKHHDDASYKNAIAGLINIAYYCLFAKDYKNALEWTDNFGEVLKEYQQRPDVSEEYVDKQLARFDIYQAQALEGLGRKEEAAKVYEKFQTTLFSKTPEGRISANDYLVAAQRWGEAADNYRSLDAMLGNNEDAYTLDNIQELVLKKYQANILAGRKDSAIAVSLQICDSLEQAFDRADKIEAEEQAAIVRKVEQLGEQQAQAQKMKQMALLSVIGLVFVCVIIFMIYRRITLNQLRSAYRRLESDFKQVEADTRNQTLIDTERLIAQDIAAATPPIALPQHKDLNIVMSHTPGRMAGDSLHDLQLRGDNLYICIGNAAGKGAKASAATAVILAQLRLALNFEQEPDRILNDINKVYTRVGEMEVKLFLGVLSLPTGQLRYSNAGCMAPIIVGEEVSQLPVTDETPIGRQRDHTFSMQETTLGKGIKLLLYSDGIVETVNEAGRPFGEKKLRGSTLQAVKMNQQLHPFLDHLLEAVRSHAGDVPQDNDQTMIVISR